MGKIGKKHEKILRKSKLLLNCKMHYGIFIKFPEVYQKEFYGVKPYSWHVIKKDPLFLSTLMTFYSSFCSLSFCLFLTFLLFLILSILFPSLSQSCLLLWMFAQMWRHHCCCCCPLFSPLFLSISSLPLNSIFSLSLLISSPSLNFNHFSKTIYSSAVIAGVAGFIGIAVILSSLLLSFLSQPKILHMGPIVSFWLYYLWAP